MDNSIVHLNNEIIQNTWLKIKTLEEDHKGLELQFHTPAKRKIIHLIILEFIFSKWGNSAYNKYIYHDKLDNII